VQLRTKREDGDRDRFVEYLKATEGVEYTTISLDVKTRSGDKDFDYLLKSSNGKLLALEVTWLADLPEELATNSMGEKTRQNTWITYSIRRLLWQIPDTDPVLLLFPYHQAPSHPKDGSGSFLMQLTFDQLTKEAMQLPAASRALFAEKLVESLDAEELDEI
jgi:hypothetical protein